MDVVPLWLPPLVLAAMASDIVGSALFMPVANRVTRVPEEKSKTGRVDAATTTWMVRGLRRLVPTFRAPRTIPSLADRGRRDASASETISRRRMEDGAWISYRPALVARLGPFGMLLAMLIVFPMAFRHARICLR